MIRLIVFDWDDVFTLGAKEGYHRCYHEALIGVGVHLTHAKEREGIVAKWGKHHKEVLKELLKEHPELVDKAKEIYEKEFFGGTFVENLILVDGSVELLVRLYKKYRLAIATGANPKVLRDEIFPKFNIPNVFFQIIHTNDIEDPEKQKPHPFMLEEIMKVQKVLPDETIFVGDAITDVQMAQAADVTPIVVLTGQLSRKEAENLNVQFIIDDVTKLEEVLERINSKTI